MAQAKQKTIGRPTEAEDDLSLKLGKVLGILSVCAIASRSMEGEGDQIGWALEAARGILDDCHPHLETIGEALAAAYPSPGALALEVSAKPAMSGAKRGRKPRLVQPKTANDGGALEHPLTLGDAAQ